MHVIKTVPTLTAIKKEEEEEEAKKTTETIGTYSLSYEIKTNFLHFIYPYYVYYKYR